ncbi:MAG: YitT family protein [Lachnospiraceae bacterium]|nr:YitT family protein [Lachnospiraceae bacterium]
MNTVVRKAVRKLHAKDLVIIALGSTIVAFATKYLLDPAGLVTGGVSGLSIIIKYLTGHYTAFEVPLWMSNFVLNVPIFLFAIYTDGWKSIVKTGIGWLLMTAELYVWPEISLMPTKNLFLVAIYGGVCFGAGTGLLLSTGATTGGTDMLGQSLHKFMRQYSLGSLIAVLDGIIVALGVAVFGVERTMFALISVFIMGRVTDYFVSKGRRAKMSLIISEAGTSIAKDILEDLDRGVTSFEGKGMYTGQNRIILMCICSNRDIPEMKNIVRDHDPKAFFVICDVNEAMGEGFIEHWK